MNDKQRRFAREYLVDLNATQAAIRAGYAAKHADVQGPRLLGNAGIRKLIEDGQQKRAERVGVTADWVLDELRKVGSQEDVAQGTKVRALELVGKHLGMFVEKIEMKVDQLSPEERLERIEALRERALRRKADGDANE